MYVIFGCCPQRYFLAVMCCLGLTISYIMRFCLTLTLTEMTQQQLAEGDPYGCPFPSPEKETAKYDSFSWTEMQQGLILSSFFWGYVVTPIPGGLLSEAIGAKPVLSVGIVVTSVVSLLTPMFVALWDWQGMILARIFLGFAQGLVYASLHTIVAHWIPLDERGTWATVVFSGSQFGNTISMLCTSWILARFEDWRIVFYLYGIIGLLWSLCFYLTIFSTPVDHPLLSDEEKEILVRYMAHVRKRKMNRGTPWLKILSSRPVIALILAMVGHDWGFFALVTDIPKYMKGVLHFNIKQNGTYLAIGYFSICVMGVFSGIVADYIARTKVISLTLNRKIMATVASIGPSFGLIAVTYSGCNSKLAVISLIVGMSFMGCYYPSLKINPIDIAPNFAGTVGALCHSVGGIAGIAVPYIIGLLTPNGFMMEWRFVFWITFIIILLSNALYCCLGTADLQPWNDDTEEDPLLSEEQNRKFLG